jgi:hypothetical protein
MKIIWTQSGDSLSLTPVNQALAEYWILALNQYKQNNFHLNSTKFDTQCTTDLRQHIQEIHESLLDKFKISVFESYVSADLFDQSVINELHRTWIKVHEKYPSLPTLLEKINASNLMHWNQINKKLHALEESFVYSYQTPQPFWEVDNPFDHQLLNFNRCHIQISFSQKGRSTYNKWFNQDHVINDTDTNNFEQIGGEIEINLRREIIQDPPVNYVEFCNANKYPVVGAYLNLANFSDYDEKLTDIRHVLSRNIEHENNTASFEL